MLIIWATVPSPCRSRFSLGFKFLLTWDFLKKHLLHGLLVVMQSYSCCMSEKVFILFLICIFLGYRILSQFYFYQHSKMWCQCPLANIVSYAKFAVIPIFCSAVSVFPSGYISLVDCFKQWIMMCLCIVVILLVLELIELLCLWV